MLAVCKIKNASKQHSRLQSQSRMEFRGFRANVCQNMSENMSGDRSGYMSVRQDECDGKCVIHEGELVGD